MENILFAGKLSWLTNFLGNKKKNLIFYEILK